MYISTDSKNHNIVKALFTAYPTAKIIEYDEITTIQYASTCKHIILSHGSFSAIIGYLSFFSSVYYSEYEFPVFTVMDSVEKYKNQMGAGLYYTESPSYIPLRGNGWYYYPMVDYCLKEKIIQPYQIKYVVLSSLSMPANYYNEFINF